MAAITIQAYDRKEADEILGKVYEADRTATYYSENEVFGSAIHATILSDNKVKIQSGYYLETTLQEMFNPTV